MPRNDTVAVIEANGRRATVRTGPYTVTAGVDLDAVRVSRRDADPNGCLAIQPGGPEGNLLKADRVDEVNVDPDASGDVTLTVTGQLDHGGFEFEVRLPATDPGVLSYELSVTGDLTAANVGEWGPELVIRDETGTRVDDAFVTYLDGTPASNPAAGTSDYNQFVYAGEDAVLDSTLLYLADWPALDEYFRRTGTNMRATVSSPPGRIGYEPPTPVDEPGTDPITVLAANLSLTPEAVAVDDPQRYCERFVDDVAALYDQLDEPDPVDVDWREVSGKTLDAVRDPANRYEYDGTFHPGGVELVTVMSIVTPYRAYAEQFDDERSRDLTADVASLVETYYDPEYEDDAGNTGMIGNSPAPLTLTHVDAWYLLWPVVQAAEYALAFDDDRIAEMVVDTADVMVDVGRELDYEFPMWVDVDNLQGHEPSDGQWDGYQYDCTGAYAYLMLQYHDLTGDDRYLEEAAAAGDRLLQYGFELPYEFTTTPLTPLAMLRLAERTGDDRYVGASYIGLANVLRHAYFFDPDYGEYEGRRVFLLNEAMPPDGYEGNFFANALEEWSVLHHLERYLREGGDALTSAAREMAAELLRHKGSSLADSLPAFQPDPSLIHDDPSPQSGRRVDREWYLPIEPFGAIAPMFDELGEVGQDLYGAGAYPEMATIQYQPLGDDATLYVGGPTAVESCTAHTWRVEPLGERGTYEARLFGEMDALIDYVVRPAGASDEDVPLCYDEDDDCYRFELAVDESYLVTRTVPTRAIIVEDFAVEPTSISVDETATVSMTVVNTSPQSGAYEVALSVGPSTLTRSLELDSYGSRDVSFAVSPDEPGRYNVTIAHENRALHVEQR
ncbi:hypothetical protein [Halomicrococcus sp. SG-WS-1]|uniref:COG1470 family protein n=1 Tax=Halomicrococcus sp. SG-WS-1 TaxID=3439057 RepID=UPI003F7A963B